MSERPGAIIEPQDVSPKETGSDRLIDSSFANPDVANYRMIQSERTRIGDEGLTVREKTTHDKMLDLERHGGLGVESEYDLNGMTLGQWKESPEGKRLKQMQDDQAKVDYDGDPKTFQRLTKIHDFLKTRDEALGNRK